MVYTSQPDLVSMFESLIASYYTYFWRLHVEHFGDSALHDQEMWVVDVKLDRAKEILYPCVVGVASVDEVFVLTTNYNLDGEKKCL